MATNKKAKSKKKNNSGLVWWIVGCVLAVALIFVFIAGATGMFAGKTTAPEPLATETTQGQQSEAPVAAPTPGVKTYEEIPEGNPIVTIEMENGKKFKIKLYPEIAPQTVANFVALAESGFYDGVGFHRIIEGFMAQGGDPEGTGMGGAEHNIYGEFAQNGFEKNNLSHTRGVVSMARSNDPNSASSQFFICYDDATSLDGQYAAFGEVTEGMEVVDSFLDGERTYNSMGEMASPVEPIVMKKVTVEK